MPMQHVFSFTLAEAWAFLIYAAGAMLILRQN